MKTAKRPRPLRFLIKTVVIAVSLAVAAAMLLGALSTLVSPESFIVPSFLGLVFPILLVADLCLVVFWLLMRSKWVLVPLAAVVILIFPIRNTFGTPFKPASTEQDTRHLRLLTYNTMGTARQVKQNPLLAYVAEGEPDVVCMQEFKVFDKSGKYLTEQDALHILKTYPYHRFDRNLKLPYGSSGLAVFSKYPIVGYKQVFSSRYNSGMYVDICVDGDTLRVFNIHMESNHLTKKDYDINPEDVKEKDVSTVAREYAGNLSVKMTPSYRIRANQASLVADEVDRSPHRVVVCGDFNDVPVSYAYSTIRHRLRDAWSETTLGYGPTFCNRPLRIRIDYILHDRRLHATGTRVDHVEHSDHYPLWSEISW